MRVLTLSVDGASASVSLDGGRLASLVVGGHELLITDGDRPSRWGMFPMIPWCGRLPYGRMQFLGRRYEMPVNSPPHANHGRSFLQPWQVESASANSLEIRTELVDPWPFGGYARQTFTLASDGLQVVADVVAGDQSMPAMAGWHPWFRRQLDVGAPAELHFRADAVYAVDHDLVPTGELAAVPPPPWNACFVGVADGPTISWPGVLTLDLSSTFDRWVIFTEPEQALCVEPQSGPPDEFRLAPHILEPGHSLTGSFTLRWR